jgi:hypothetical protein
MRTVVTGTTAQAPTLSAPSVEACGVPLSFSCLPDPIRFLKNTKIPAKLSSRSCHIRLNESLWARSAHLSKRKIHYHFSSFLSVPSFREDTSMILAIHAAVIRQPAPEK